jgi:hypothetical protein
MKKRSPIALRVRVLRKKMRVGAYALYDQVVKPKARSAKDTPWSPDAITVDWLNDTVAKSCPGAAITGFKLGSGSSGTSVRRQISLTYREPVPEGAPPSMFMKTSPTLLTRMANSGSGVSVAEGNFYRLLRPELNIEAPIGYYSSFDKASCRSIHLLEDLVATKGARFCNWKTIIDRQKIEYIVDLLAEFHGHYYGDPRLEAMSGWMRTFPQWVRSGFINSGFDVQHRRAFVEGADLMPAKLRNAGQASWDAVIASLDMHDQSPKTLIHSDVHLGNWYVTAAGHMGLCDWQCISRGHWARDLAYAIATTLSVENRQNWERDMVARYAEKLSMKTGKAFSFEEAFSAYRRQLPAALLMWTTTLCPPPIMPDMQPLEMSREMVKRLAYAIADNDAVVA